MFIDQPSGGLILQAITIRLSPDASCQHAEGREEIVLRALAAALIALDESSSLAWRVQAAPGGEPLLYRLTPLPGRPVALGDVRRMLDTLRRQALVAAAEPVFSHTMSSGGAPPA